MTSTKKRALRTGRSAGRRVLTAEHGRHAAGHRRRAVERPRHDARAAVPPSGPSDGGTHPRHDVRAAGCGRRGLVLGAAVGAVAVLLVRHKVRWMLALGALLLDRFLSGGDAEVMRDLRIARAESRRRATSSHRTTRVS